MLRLLLLTPAVRFAKALHFLADLEGSHQLLDAGELQLQPTLDPFLHRIRPPREPLPVRWAPSFAIQATDYVLRYYKEEYEDDEYYRDRRLNYVAFEHAQRLRILQESASGHPSSSTVVLFLAVVDPACTSLCVASPSN